MKLFHGSANSAAPTVKVGPFALGFISVNIFDGIFGSPSYDAAGSHGCNGYVHSYEIADDKIAESRDLNEHYEEVCAFLKEELEVDDVEEIADRVVWDNDSDVEDFSNIMSPRFDTEGDDSLVFAALCWELQRLRGRVAAHLGFDAVEMNDEHGTSYLIVNPKIIAE
ncbi:hypothetical protein OO184_18515 [Photorhabdus sp. APURE]|uniref:hypothetical protein n=1 Tax=Photorhabdus aballayi TaxID=2991723 RepID=UPI00223DB025|nr:hypothetical protein [Photorhabdus aballayi]MCW7549873.1 hypothetical protein [Photorhabdus aballayi]